MCKLGAPRGWVNYLDSQSRQGRKPGPKSICVTSKLFTLPMGMVGGQAFFLFVLLFLFLFFCYKVAKQLITFAILHFITRKGSSLGNMAWGLQTYISKSLDNHLPEYFIRRLFSQNQVKASLKYCVRPRPKGRNIIPLTNTPQTSVCARYHARFPRTQRQWGPCPCPQEFQDCDFM